MIKYFWGKAMFELKSPFKPQGDQPQAIKKLVKGLSQGLKHQTLLGVTGSGKTFTMANVIAQVKKPTLVISHNKTLAAQLASEFCQFFPNDHVCYFVSYYDYYQPEAYLPQTDTYIEKETSINEEIERLRSLATHSLLNYPNVIIVASVSCLYGLGNPQTYQALGLKLKKGDDYPLRKLLGDLLVIQYKRNDQNFYRGTVRVRGDRLDVWPFYSEKAIRVDFFGHQIEKIGEFDPLTGDLLAEKEEVKISPASHFVSAPGSLTGVIHQIKRELKSQLDWLKERGKLLEAQRLEQRTNFDLEMLQEIGYCNGIENYSRYFDGRSPGEPPFTLIDYFPSDYLLFIDESHMTLPQIRGMYLGDRSRKETLVEYGFRLPSCLDNRPLKFAEFEEKVNQVIYVSATPAEYELRQSSKGLVKSIKDLGQEVEGIAEQLIRPTGILDPQIEVRKTEGQIDDLISEIQKRVAKKERVLITTLTKRMAEDLAEYLADLGIKAFWIHSEVETLKRLDILRDLRQGKYDVLVGINLLREGLDLPEVSLVVILDADKEGYLRSETALIQVMGRAARHINGQVIMYADKITKSMQTAIQETQRRRKIQAAFNQKHKITPQPIKKEIKDILIEREVQEEEKEFESINLKKISSSEIRLLIKDLENQMKLAADNLEFEKAALLRDEIKELEEELERRQISHS